MNRREKNQLIQISKAAKDFYAGVTMPSFAVSEGGVNKLLHKLFNAIDDSQGTQSPLKRNEKITVGINDSNVMNITPNGEITINNDSGEYTVWNESYSDVICTTSYKSIAEFGLKFYAEEILL